MAMTNPSRAGAASKPRTRKLGKRQQERAARAFTDACLEAFRQLGAKPCEPFYINDNRHAIETKAGTLRMSPCPMMSGGHGGQIFCRFDDVERAKLLLPRDSSISGLNPYSGKWNQYYFDEADSARIVEDFVRRVRPLLPSAAP